MSAAPRNMAGPSGDAHPALRASTAVHPGFPEVSQFGSPSLELAPASAGGFSITLPLPPSTNNLFITVGKRRARSSDYSRWLEAAAWAIHQERPAPVAGPYAFMIALPRFMRGDCSNRIKAPEDLLVRHGLTPDDRHADLVLAHRTNAVSGVACVVTVVPIQHVSVALAGVGGGPRRPSVLPRQEDAEAA